MYTSQAMDHFLKPRNVGSIAVPSGRGEATNEACGDTAVITISVADGLLTEVRFVSQSCAGGIAACSAATEWATGRTVGKALALDADAVAELLGGLPDAKLGCAEMAASALRNAVESLP